MGHCGHSSIATLVEGTTRYVLLAHVGNERFAEVLSASSHQSPAPVASPLATHFDLGPGLRNEFPRGHQRCSGDGCPFL